MDSQKPIRDEVRRQSNEERSGGEVKVRKEGVCNGRARGQEGPVLVVREGRRSRVWKGKRWVKEVAAGGKGSGGMCVRSQRRKQGPMGEFPYKLLTGPHLRYTVLKKYYFVILLYLYLQSHKSEGTDTLKAVMQGGKIHCTHFLLCLSYCFSNFW